MNGIEGLHESSEQEQLEALYAQLYEDGFFIREASSFEGAEFPHLAVVGRLDDLARWVHKTPTELTQDDLAALDDGEHDVRMVPGWGKTRIEAVRSARHAWDTVD